MIQEAKTLLATKPLRTAMARRDVAQLRAAIEVVEGEEDVDGAVVEVSGCGQRTRARRAMRAIHVIIERLHTLLQLTHACRRPRRCWWRWPQSYYKRRWRGVTWRS